MPNPGQSQSKIKKNLKRWGTGSQRTFLVLLPPHPLYPPNRPSSLPFPSPKQPFAVTTPTDHPLCAPRSDPRSHSSGWAAPHLSQPRLHHRYKNGRRRTRGACRCVAVPSREASAGSGTWSLAWLPAQGGGGHPGDARAGSAAWLCSAAAGGHGKVPSREAGECRGGAGPIRPIYAPAVSGCSYPGICPCPAGSPVSCLAWHPEVVTLLGPSALGRQLQGCSPPQFSAPPHAAAEELWGALRRAVADPDARACLEDKLEVNQVTLWVLTPTLEQSRRTGRWDRRCCAETFPAWTSSQLLRGPLRSSSARRWRCRGGSR